MRKRVTSDFAVLRHYPDAVILGRCRREVAISIQSRGTIVEERRIGQTAMILGKLVVYHRISFPLLILLHRRRLLGGLWMRLLLGLLLLMLLESCLSGGGGSSGSSLLLSLFNYVFWWTSTSFATRCEIRLASRCRLRSGIIETDLFPVQRLSQQFVVILMNVVGGEVFHSQFGLQDFSHNRSQGVTVGGRNLGPIARSIDVAHLPRQYVRHSSHTNLFHASLSSGTTPSALASCPEDIWLISERCSSVTLVLGEVIMEGSIWGRWACWTAIGEDDDRETTPPP